MTLEQAIHIVAVHAIHFCAARAASWEDYPEIGEADWYLVLAEIERLTPAPDPTQFTKAYALLEKRAEATS